MTGTSSEMNRAWWDERVGLHVDSDFYDLPGFLAGGDPLRPFEVEEVGPVEDLRLAHLQCHIGLDTLGWARRGARVTGLDFSGPAVEAAERLAAEAGLEARFVQSDVYEAPAALGGRFDVVYTGLGALNWLPDIERWASTVAKLIEPGGFLYLSEFHPISWVFGDDELDVTYDYFGGRVEFEEPGTYADLEADTTHNRTEEWPHSLGAVLSAILGAGLTIELFREHDHTLMPRWPFLEADRGGIWRWPAGRPRLPLMYSVRARA